MISQSVNRGMRIACLVEEENVQTEDQQWPGLFQQSIQPISQRQSSERSVNHLDRSLTTLLIPFR